MTGGLLQLAAYGAQDIYLTGNPQITYFVGVYRRYTNFSVQSIPQYFIGNADFGQKVYILVDRIGDLINQMFLRIKLPDISQYNYNDESGNLVEYYWVNSIGHAIIKIIDVEIGGVVIDRQYGLWMEIWGELTTPVGKKAGYNSMIGKSDFPVNLDNGGPLDLYVPMYFWFCRNVGLSLPLIAIQSQEVRFNVTFRQYEELVISSTGVPLIPNNNPLQIVQAWMDIDYIFLEDDERKIFARNNHQYLIEHLYFNDYRPQYQNVKMKNMQQNLCEFYDGTTWKLIEESTLIHNIIVYSKDIIDNHFIKNKKKFSRYYQERYSKFSSTFDEIIIKKMNGKIKNDRYEQIYEKIRIYLITKKENDRVNKQKKKLDITV